MCLTHSLVGNRRICAVIPEPGGCEDSREEIHSLSPAKAGFFLLPLILCFELSRNDWLMFFQFELFNGYSLLMRKTTEEIFDEIESKKDRTILLGFVPFIPFPCSPSIDYLL